jgi:adenylosuccinate lyase
MGLIWSDHHRYATWLEVELAACQAWENRGVIPAGVTARLREKSKSIDWEKFSGRVDEIEKTTRHDVIAFLSALEESLGEESRFVHLGMTSSDVVDTAFALLLVEAGEQLHNRLEDLFEVLVKRALEHRRTLCLGRTHGQAAEPTTFGLKLLTYVSEADRARKRLATAIKEVAHAKLSGAVGNFGNIEPGIEADVMKALRLYPEPISTQVVPRDRHAMFFSTLAVIGGLVERLAVEIRHLQRTEVSEAYEPFGKGQKGSSAMPHKKNPILTENVTGLARLLRGYAMTALENQPLWHERDISHSSAERLIGPDATTGLDFALKRVIRVMDGLVVDENNMQENLKKAGDIVYSGGVLIALCERGVLRQEAYGWVQRAAMKARENLGSFKKNLEVDDDVKSHLSPAELDQLFTPEHHLRHVDQLFERVIVEEEKPGPDWRPR